MGWSVRRGCLAAAEFATEDAFETGVSPPIMRIPSGPGSHVGTMSTALPPSLRFTIPLSPEDMLQFSRAQIQAVRELPHNPPFEGPCAPFGGRLFVADIGRDTLTLSMVGALGLPQRRDDVAAVPLETAG